VACRSLLVVLDPHVETERLIAEASELADEESTVTALVVLEVPPALPFDAPLGKDEAMARSLLRRAETAGAARGLHVERRLVRARDAGKAIAAVADEQGIDRIVAPPRRRVASLRVHRRRA
jgi:hypothetical protein